MHRNLRARAACVLHDAVAADALPSQNHCDCGKYRGEQHMAPDEYPAREAAGAALPTAGTLREALRSEASSADRLPGCSGQSAMFDATVAWAVSPAKSHLLSRPTPAPPPPASTFPNGALPGAANPRAEHLSSHVAMRVLVACSAACW
jgi:hypothetical protein